MIDALDPDIVLVQEFNYLSNSDADIQAMADKAVGSGAFFYRENGAQIPNGIISRYPLLQGGTWVDPSVSNRSFVWVRIDVPGDRDLWAVSVHLLTSNATVRNVEATNLVGDISALVPAADLLVLGGDFNTSNRAEPCVTTLSSLFVTTGPYPVDGNGLGNTNGPRSKPYDWVLADPDLDPLAIPVVIGSNTFVSGLVFDSRVYTPLSEVAPVLASDSAAVNMQHMAVIRDFALPTP
jgi:hypothetical protein